MAHLYEEYMQKQHQRERQQRERQRQQQQQQPQQQQQQQYQQPSQQPMYPKLPSQIKPNSFMIHAGGGVKNDGASYSGGGSSRPDRIAEGAGIRVVVVPPSEDCPPPPNTPQPSHRRTHISRRRSSSAESRTLRDPLTHRLHVGTSSSSRRIKPNASCFVSFDDVCSSGDSVCSGRSSSDKKQNHSEIEKRRRDKLNDCIAELAGLVPQCRSQARKLDKLSILRMAVQHITIVRGNLAPGKVSEPPPESLVPGASLSRLVVEAVHGSRSVVAVVDCDDGRFLYLSGNCESVLNYTPPDLLGQSMFDILAPKDVAPVKEQLVSYNPPQRERLIDAKTMLPLDPEEEYAHSWLTPGAKRTFYCRVKCPVPRDDPRVKDEPDNGPRRYYPKKYIVIYCSGYITSWSALPESDGASAGAAHSFPPGYIGSQFGFGVSSLGPGGSSLGPGVSSLGPGGPAPGPSIFTSTPRGSTPRRGGVRCLVALVRTVPDILAERRFGVPYPSTDLWTPTEAAAFEFNSRQTADGTFVFIDHR